MSDSPLTATSANSLHEWLAYIERAHPQSIAMGLTRVRAVKEAMRLDPRCVVITVGGTNGKGSACMMLEAMLHHAGYRVACYTSPHLIRYNERVRIARAAASDADLCRAFAVVEQARAQANVSLTYFEFGTLAAVWLFGEAGVDVAILEVGLGGRLDAVNVFEPDCALVMSVAMDHMEYLGDTREKIGFEKAGIYRAGKPAIFADFDPPQTLVDHARAIGAQLILRGRDFDARPAATQWAYRGPGGARHGLPWPVLRGQYQLANAAACIAALDTLRARLPVSVNDIRGGLLTAENPGRFQVLPGQPMVILDVAHNPHAAQAMAESLKRLRTNTDSRERPRTNADSRERLRTNADSRERLSRGGRVLAVFAMLADKDIAGVIAAVKPQVSHWYVAGIDAPRGASSTVIEQKLAAAGVTQFDRHESVTAALQAARGAATLDDKIIVFGSFYTVSEAMQALRKHL